MSVYLYEQDMFNHKPRVRPLQTQSWVYKKTQNMLKTAEEIHKPSYLQKLR